MSTPPTTSPPQGGPRRPPRRQRWRAWLLSPYHRAVAWAVPPQLSPQEHNRSQLLLGLATGGGALIFLTGVVNYLRISPAAGLSIMGVSLLVGVGTVLAIRWTRSVALGAHYLLLLAYGLMVLTAWLKGGVHSTPPHWALGLVLLACSTLPLPQALLWTALLALMPFGLVASQELSQWPGSLGTPWLYAVSRAAICWMTFGVVHLFERQRILAQNQRHLREQDQRTRNQRMRLILQHADQGFAMLDAQARISPQRSQQVDTWLGGVVAGMHFAQLLERYDRNCAAWFTLGWDNLQDTAQERPRSLDQLPDTCRVEGRTLRLSYKALVPMEQLDKPGQNVMMVILSDVTHTQRQRQAQAHRRELEAIFQQVVQAPLRFMDFYTSAQSLLQQFQAGQSRPEEFWRRLHHLHRDSRAYGLHHLASACERLEQDHAQSHPTMAEIAPLWEAWMQTQSHLRLWLPQLAQAQCPISTPHLQQFLELLQSRAPHEQLLEASRRWERHELPTRPLARHRQPALSQPPGELR